MEQSPPWADRQTVVLAQVEGVGPVAAYGHELYRDLLELATVSRVRKLADARRQAVEQPLLRSFLEVSEHNCRVALEDLDDELVLEPDEDIWPWLHDFYIERMPVPFIDRGGPDGVLGELFMDYAWSSGGSPAGNVDYWEIEVPLEQFAALVRERGLRTVLVPPEVVTQFFDLPVDDLVLDEGVELTGASEEQARS